MCCLQKVSKQRNPRTGLGMQFRRSKCAAHGQILSARKVKQWLPFSESTLGAWSNRKIRAEENWVFLSVDCQPGFTQALSETSAFGLARTADPQGGGLEPSASACRAGVSSTLSHL